MYVAICNHRWLISLAVSLYGRVCMLYICYTSNRPCEVETKVDIESPEDEPEDGDILDEDVEDDVHTDEDDHDI